jgi:hypothetical protein
MVLKGGSTGSGGTEIVGNGMRGGAPVPLQPGGVGVGTTPGDGCNWGIGGGGLSGSRKMAGVGLEAAAFGARLGACIAASLLL